MIANKEFSKALPAIKDSLALPNWRETYGTHLILAEAYCMLNDENGFIDTIKIRENLSVLSEQKINDTPEFF